MNFRRCILAMAMLALFVSLASAQVVTPGSPGGTLNCGTGGSNTAVTPQLRAEGMTELIGDIVIQCTGGSVTAPGAAIPTVNITVSLATNVTSRLLGSGGVTNASEALLLIDEPGTSPPATAPAAGVGPAAPITVCGSPGFGAGPGGTCGQVAGTAGAGITVATTTVNAGGAATGTTYNAFQGLVTANQVTFLGVPVLPPSTAGFTRVFRITNVRANVSAIGGGGLPGTTQLLASISISGSTSLPVQNPIQIAGLIQSGLTTGLRNTGNGSAGGNTNLAQCGGGGPSPLNIVRFSENFGTAFKTRVFPSSATAGSGQFLLSPQNVPGTIYNSESGLVVSGLQGNGATAGLADFGTRLKASFNNIPAGLRIFVSTANVTNDFLNPIAAPAAGNSTSSYAVLVANETVPEGNTSPPSNATFNGYGVTVNVFELPVINGSASAVWEVINTNPSALESLDFGVYWAFTANPGANSPPTGSATVNLSYAPTPPGPFSATAGAAASGSLPIPRFADTSSGTNIATIVLCQTTLLFPFVTNLGGFDTGIAIANTTTDPFGTRVQSGSCTLNFYGTAAPAAVTTGNIATATVYTTLASTAAAGFQGYMIAVCNFQLAHGFAFISDIGARNLAMGYLALVVQTGTGNRNSGNLPTALSNSVEVLGN